MDNVLIACFCLLHGSRALYLPHVLHVVAKNNSILIKGMQNTFT